MRPNVPELTFASRADFRRWLTEHAAHSDSVWLVFGKTRDVVTLSAGEALEEALCFGWIDGQMQRIDDSRYRKYFARRRVKSHWSEKNKKMVETLKQKGIMTRMGEEAVEAAKRNGLWDVDQQEAIIDEQVDTFAQKLAGISPARENFDKMSLSVRRTYVKRYLSFKTEEARQRDFDKIIERLNNNLKPM